MMHHDVCCTDAVESETEVNVESEASLEEFESTVTEAEAEVSVMEAVESVVVEAVASLIFLVPFVAVFSMFDNCCFCSSPTLLNTRTPSTLRCPVLDMISCSSNPL